MRIRDERDFPRKDPPRPSTFADVPVGTVFKCSLTPHGSLSNAVFFKGGMEAWREDGVDEYPSTHFVVRLDDPENVWTAAGMWVESEQQYVGRLANMVMYSYEELDAELVLRDKPHA